MGPRPPRFLTTPNFQQMPKNGLAALFKAPRFKRLQWRRYCNPSEHATWDKTKMTLKIERDSDGPRTTIRLIGRMRAEHLKELEKQIRESGPAITLDLEEVTLVNLEIVRFLVTCQPQAPPLPTISPHF